MMIEVLYRAKPRRAATIDAYCRIFNSSQSALLCAREALQYGDPAAPAIRRMMVWRAKAERFLDALKADPYVCKSEAKKRAWQAGR